MNLSVESIFFLVIGLLFLVGVILNWRIFTGSGKLTNRLLGPTVTRIVYSLFGLVLLGLGIGLLFGWITM